MSDQNIKVLVVEDEATVRAGLEDNLKFEGYRVVSCDNGLTGVELFKQERPDIVILDVMMPGIDGLEVCRQIRALNPGVPIIMLTARSGEVDRVVGLEIGADDYLPKPFSMRELFARMKAILRRSQPAKNGSASSELSDLNFSDVTVDFRTYRAKKGLEEIFLSAKEFELLRFLAAQPDVPVTRDQLLDQVWGYNNYPTTRTVDNFIARLRQKVEDVPDKPRHILTVHGVGYKFVR